MYAVDYDGVLPHKLSILYPNYVSTFKIFKCPSTSDKIFSSDEIDEKSSYIYVSGLTENDPFFILAQKTYLSCGFKEVGRSRTEKYGGLELIHYKYR